MRHFCIALSMLSAFFVIVSYIGGADWGASAFWAVLFALWAIYFSNREAK